MGSFLSSMIPWNLIHDQRVKDTEQDRISNEEFGWNEEMANTHNTNEIGRQSEFLKGMEPQEAKTYNQYQDDTYGEDTRRQAERDVGVASAEGQAMKLKAAAAGMSPWELQGGSGASPLPAGQFMAGQTKNSSDLNTTSLMQTKMQTDTQKTVAAMQADASLRSTAMQTGNQRYLAEQTPQAKAGVQRTLAETALTWSQDYAVNNDRVLKQIANLAKNAGTTTTEIGPVKKTTQNDGIALMQLQNELTNNPTSGGDRETNYSITRRFIQKLTANQWQGFRRDLSQAAKAAAGAAGDVTSGIGKYLRQTTKQ